MRFVAWRELSDGYRSAVDGHSPWNHHERNADPIFVEDVTLLREPPKLIATVLAEGIHALAFIPVAGAAELSGKFMVYYDTPRVFTDHERDIALTIARQLGFAIARFTNDAAAQRLTALVESSEDAIIAKDLDGIITDWNPGAERLFGYGKQEVVGRSVTLLIPEDRQDEEPNILERIRRGERIEHFETVRLHKDGRPIDISLMISPIRDATGQVVGASKIARDISDRRRTQEQQQLLLHEMNHRVKNVFALASGIVNLSAHSAASPAELASIVAERLATLARAHNLTMSPAIAGYEPAPIKLHELLKAILAPYHSEQQRRLEIHGADATVPPAIVTSLSLLLHEFATNSAKYGSLSKMDGIVDITCTDGMSEFMIIWRETGGPPPEIPTHEGFGSRLVKATASQLGRVSRVWTHEGAVIELAIERNRLVD
jgi:PAS domain S-box-containing protein